MDRCEISGEFNFPFKVREKSRNWDVEYKNRGYTKISVTVKSLDLVGDRGETSPRISQFVNHARVLPIVFRSIFPIFPTVENFREKTGGHIVT